MNSVADLAIYKEILLFLATAGIVAPLFFRMRISPVPVSYTHLTLPTNREV